MAQYRNALPQLKGGTFLSDGGMETTLIFHEGVDLPDFASFVLLDTADGRARLKAYYERYLAIARDAGAGFVLDTATWRANPDWGTRLGYDAAGLKRIDRASIALLTELRDKWQSKVKPIVVGGAIGPRGDAYKAGRMTANEAEEYHSAQVAAFAETEADMVSAYTLNQVAEAVGVARAAKENAMPCMISFTVETDGRLATGPSLREAIEETDAETGSSPAYYMINCAHPVHFMQALERGEAWTKRVLGAKANASQMSHAELDNATELDPGDPADLGRRYKALRAEFPAMRILGGCCGTDHRHVAAISEECCGKKAA